MSRTARLFELLQLLRARRRPVSGTVLANELGVSLRTLYRDVATLESMGAAIVGEPGLGYVMRPGFTLPPLMFTDEETEALALGLKWVSRRADDGLGAAAREALAKVGAVLPERLRHRIDDSPLAVGPGWERPQRVELALLRHAIRDECKLDVSYTDERGRATLRTIWPFAITFFESTRILAAWCELREDYRYFRTDRIDAARPTGERYPRRRQALQKEWRQRLLTKPVSACAYTSATPTPTEAGSMDQEIVFYTNPWSRGGIVHWMLEEVGKPYRIEILDFGPQMKSPEYLAINPMGKVPAVRHGDTVVTEAAAICAYLADAFPEAGLAPPPNERGAYYRWLFFTAGPLEMAISLKSCGVEPTPQQQGQLGCGSYQSAVDTLAAAVAGRRYIAGDRFTAADVYVGSHIGWGMQFGTLEKRPEFEAYWNGLKDRPANRRADEFAAKWNADKTSNES